MQLLETAALCLVVLAQVVGSLPGSDPAYHSQPLPRHDHTHDSQTQLFNRVLSLLPADFSTYPSPKGSPSNQRLATVGELAHNPDFHDFIKLALSSTISSTSYRRIKNIIGEVFDSLIVTDEFLPNAIDFVGAINCLFRTGGRPERALTSDLLIPGDIVGTGVSVLLNLNNEVVELDAMMKKLFTFETTIKTSNDGDEDDASNNPDNDKKYIHKELWVIQNEKKRDKFMVAMIHRGTDTPFTHDATQEQARRYGKVLKMEEFEFTKSDTDTVLRVMTTANGVYWHVLNNTMSEDTTLITQPMTNEVCEESRAARNETIQNEPESCLHPLLAQDESMRSMKFHTQFSKSIISGYLYQITRPTHSEIIDSCYIRVMKQCLVEAVNAPDARERLARIWDIRVREW